MSSIYRDEGFVDVGDMPSNKPAPKLEVDLSPKIIVRTSTESRATKVGTQTNLAVSKIGKKFNR